MENNHPTICAATRTLRRVFVSLFLVSFCATTTHASESDWGAGTLTRIRLLAPGGGIPPSGAAQIAIEIKIPDGSKTYWKTSGVAGLPTTVNWRESENVAAVQLGWPIPKRLIDPEVPWLPAIGYIGGMTLLADVMPADRTKSMNFAIELELGVCDDVCIQDFATTGINLPPLHEPPAAADALLNSIRATLPMPNGSEGLSVVAADRTPDNDSILVTARSKTDFGDPDLLPHSQDPACHQRSERAMPDLRTAMFRISASCAEEASAGVTLVDRGRAVDATVPVGERRQ